MSANKSADALPTFREQHEELQRLRESGVFDDDTRDVLLEAEYGALCLWEKFGENATMDTLRARVAGVMEGATK